MRTNALILAAVLACSALAYLPSLGGDFVWDDRPLILDDEQVHSFANLPRLFVRDFFAPGSDDFEYGYYRPLISTSYLLDWALWGRNPLGYRLANLLWHLLTTALLFLLLLKLLPSARWAALLGAALFGLHPAHTESVAWIAGRTDVICAAFVLAALLFWLLYLESNRERLDFVPKKKKKRTTRAMLWYYGLAVLCVFLSLMAKEMGVVALLAAPLVAWHAGGQKWSKLKILLPEFAGLLVALVAYFILRTVVAGVTTGEPSTQHTLWKALATFPGAFAAYLGKLLVPWRLTAYIVHPYVAQPFTLWGTIGLLALALLLALIWRGRRAAPTLALSAGALLLSFLPLANLIRISGPSDMGFVMAERFLYLPSVFFCIFLAAFAAWLVAKVPRVPQEAIIALLVIASLAYGVRTAFAARTWTDEGRLYEQALAVNENAPLLWANLGAYYRRQGRLDDAIAALNKAEQLNRELRSADWVSIYNNLGTAMASAGNLTEALGWFNKALAAGGQEDRVQFNRGEALRLLGRAEEAAAAYDASLRVNPNYLEPRLRRAQVRFATGNLAGAADDLQAVLAREPNQPDALANLGML
ncbi:MAG: tetratricopeptide repeat protein, partial [Alphaproteobacteria bacterium]